MNELFQNDPNALAELEEFAQELIVVAPQVGDFLPSGSPQWLMARRIGEAICAKYGKKGMRFVYDLVRKQFGGRDASLDLAWDGICGWMG